LPWVTKVYNKFLCQCLELGACLSSSNDGSLHSTMLYLLEVKVEVTLRLTVSQYVLVSGTPLGPMNSFTFSFLLSKNCISLRLGAQSVSGQSRGGLVTIHYCLTWDYWVPFPSPLTTRRDYDGSVLTRLHTGLYRKADPNVISALGKDHFRPLRLKVNFAFQYLNVEKFADADDNCRWRNV
jgi:hypothetical protein